MIHVQKIDAPKPEKRLENETARPNVGMNTPQTSHFDAEYVPHSTYIICCMYFRECSMKPLCAITALFVHVYALANALFTQD